MTTKQLSISEFKARCSGEIRAVENDGTIIELTRHGKPVAVVQALGTTKKSETLADWLGSGRGTMRYASGYDPEAPAWAPDEWDGSLAGIGPTHDPGCSHNPLPLA